VGGYYYLMAQLPGIVPGGSPSITYGRFAETASRFLDARDKAILDGLSLEPPRTPEKTGSALVDDWYAFERALRLSLRKIRAAKMSRDAQTTADDEASVYAESGTALIARNATAFDSPLEAEKYLDKARMDFIQGRAATHGFDSDAVFAYGLTLLLNERARRFTAEAGRASYTTIYNQILGD